MGMDGGQVQVTLYQTIMTGFSIFLRPLKPIELGPRTDEQLIHMNTVMNI